MNTRRIFVVLLAATLGAFFSGCTTKTAKDSSIPWSRPASWEGGVPGMGSPDGGR